MRRILAAAVLLAAPARADDAGVAYPTISSGPEPQAYLLIENGFDPNQKRPHWPKGCTLVFTQDGDLRLTGADVDPCAEKLETAARLARAAQRVNRSARKKAIR